VFCCDTFGTLVTRKRRGCLRRVEHATGEDVLLFNIIIGHPILRTVEWIAYINRTPEINEVYIKLYYATQAGASEATIFNGCKSFRQNFGLYKDRSNGFLLQELLLYIRNGLTNRLKN